MKRIRAYTLVEVLVTLALLVSLLGLSVPVYQNFQLINEIDSAVTMSVRVLRSAQVQSQSVQQDSSWGVFFSSGKATIFKGANYAARDVAFDQAYDIPINVSISGINDIVYSKLTGDPSVTGSINFSNFSNVKTITINAKGALTY